MKSPLSNSLTELGYNIEVIDEKDANGEWIFKVTPPSIFIKSTKRGKLKAFKSKTDKTETSIQGLYGLELKGNDLVGKRSAPAKQPVSA